MKGLILCLIVIVAADAVRSQGIPKTRTKKGKRPARLNDNPDFGLPSGADYPDSQRLNPKRPAPAGRPVAAQPLPPAGRPVAARPVPPASANQPPAARPNPAVPGRRPAPVKAVPARANANVIPPRGAPTLVRSGPPPPNRRIPAGRNDNPDRGLPNGKDVPDNRVTRTRSGPPPPKVAKSQRRFNDNPDFGLPMGRDYPDAWFYPMPLPPAPVPVFDCDFSCRNDGYSPVCTKAGNTYENDCLRQCRNEPLDCNKECPCEGKDTYSAPVVPAAVGPCDYCYDEGYSPVCSDEETIFNECLADCQRNTVTCTGACPCV